MIEFVTGALLLLGAFFLIVAAVGLLRMPDLFMRMSTSTKAAVLCVGFVLAGGGVYFADLAVTTKVITVVVFVGLTAPVAAHMIGRAAYLEGVSLWEGTLFDELKGKYDPATHDPGSPAASSPQDGPGTQGIPGPEAPPVRKGTSNPRRPSKPR